jgi:hypothetical protein
MLYLLRVAIANKTGVPPYGPYLKSPSVYERNSEFREFFLTKRMYLRIYSVRPCTHYCCAVVNSERAAMYAPDFKGKVLRTNKTLLEDMTKTFVPKAKEARGLRQQMQEALGNVVSTGDSAPQT